MYALTAKGMKYMDQYAIQAGLPGVVLMENAARGVADEVAARIPDKSAKILVLAGHGNNGGDAVAVARWLAQKGYSGVSVYFAGRIDKVSDELKRQMSVLVNSHRDVRISGLRGVERNILNARYDCIIDGIYGIGLNKALGDDDIRLVKYITDMTEAENAAAGHFFPARRHCQEPRKLRSSKSQHSKHLSQIILL